MIAQYTKTVAAMLAALFVLCAGLLWLDAGRIEPIPGTILIEDALICADPTCAAAIPTALPHRLPKTRDGQLRAISLSTRFELTEIPIELQAVYIPKFSDHIGVTVNGQVLSVTDMKRRRWAEPVFLEVPLALLNVGTNTLDFVVVGRPTEGMELYPIYVGSRETLRPAFNLRHTIGPGAARFTLICTFVLGAMYLLVWTNRRDDARYLWLGLSSASACIVLLHFGYGVLWGGYKFWTGAMHLSIALYALFNMKFIRQSLRLDELLLERLLLGVVIVAGIYLFIMSEDQMPEWTLVVNISTGVSAVFTLSLYWIHRDRVIPLDFYVIFTCLLCASALGVHDMMLNHNPVWGWSFYMFHFVPVCMSCVCLWVIASQLLRSLRGYEALTNSLNDTLAQKTLELEQSFARIAQVERREAVDGERSRIMLDLHDGIGGQLVSTLAYMESTGNTDATLKDALKAALQDLALVLDSLDSHDSLTTLLGMLRTRLEPLLADHGLKFNWKVMDDPVVPDAGPSSSLHLARIVQEAITNVIKHAQASTITIYTDATTIVIADDGIGIDPQKSNDPTAAGHGLAGMRQRAASMHADFEIEGSDRGTSILLRFSGGQVPAMPGGWAS